MSALQIFCRQVRARSAENRVAVGLMHGRKLSSQVVGILRQEVDSLVRVIYLLSISDRQRRSELIQASANGRQWTHAGTKKRITDREMVELAQELHGWTESVYRFGCAFIHLSSFHDYRDRDPMSAISDEEREAILVHMRHYHGGPAGNNATFADLVPYLPMVFEKISSNLECYVAGLERNEDLER